MQHINVTTGVYVYSSVVCWFTPFDMGEHLRSYIRPKFDINVNICSQVAKKPHSINDLQTLQYG